MITRVVIFNGVTPLVWWRGSTFWRKFAATIFYLECEGSTFLRNVFTILVSLSARRHIPKYTFQSVLSRAALFCECCGLEHCFPSRSPRTLTVSQGLFVGNWGKPFNFLLRNSYTTELKNYSSNSWFREVSGDCFRSKFGGTYSWPLPRMPSWLAQRQICFYISRWALIQIG
jgi:hypothetical protein